MKIVAISDTHSMHNELSLPEGDVLVHAGDLTARGTINQFTEFVNWFEAQPHKHKVFTCGNHDQICENSLDYCRSYVPAGIHFLVDQSVIIEGKKFYGSPWTPKFFDWSYMRTRGSRMDMVWDLVPQDTDVLITHTPPYGHGDMTIRGSVVGCLDLLVRVREVRPALHIFGHIHEGYGVSISDDINTTQFVNAASLNYKHQPVNAPIVVELE